MCAAAASASLARTISSSTGQCQGRRLCGRIHPAAEDTAEAAAARHIPRPAGAEEPEAAAGRFKKLDFLQGCDKLNINRELIQAE